MTYKGASGNSTFLLYNIGDDPPSMQMDTLPTRRIEGSVVIRSLMELPEAICRNDKMRGRSLLNERRIFNSVRIQITVNSNGEWNMRDYIEMGSCCVEW